MIEFTKIVGLSVLAAVSYGIIHDQITARLCVEYFTIGHPPVFRTADPTLLGLGWGIIATWWVGLILGVLLACAARLGREPRIVATALVRPLLVMLVFTGVIAAVAGIVGSHLATIGSVRLHGDIAERVPAEKHIAFIADLSAHSASYGCGALGGVILCVLLIRDRRRRRSMRQPGLTASANT